MHLAQAMMKDLSEKKELKARFLLRVVPIEMTCKVSQFPRIYQNASTVSEFVFLLHCYFQANMDDLERTAGRLFDTHFKSDPTTYAVVYT